MVSWVISIGTFILPIHNPLSIRLLFSILGTFSLLIWLLILKKKKIPEKFWLYFFVLFCLNPMLGLGSILATPDVLLVFFWSLSYYFFLDLIESGKKLSYFLLGCSLGLGFCSKYHIVLFVIGGALCLFANRSFKKLKPLGILITLLSGLVFSLPVLIWNYQNNWSSFLYQLNHGFGRPNYDSSWTTSFILGQIALLSPFVFLYLFNFKFDFKKLISYDRIFSVSQLLFFLSSTFKSVVEANWTISAYPHALVNFVEQANEKKVKWTLIYWIVIYAALGLLLVSPKADSILSKQLSTTQIRPLVPYAQKYQPLFGPNYQISALLTWESQTFVSKLNGFSRKDFFNELSQSKPDPTKNFFVLKEIAAGWPEYLEKAHFTKIETFENLELELYQVSYE